MLALPPIPEAQAATGVSFPTPLPALSRLTLLPPTHAFPPYPCLWPTIPMLLSMNRAA